MKKINIVAWNNGGGLSRDISTLVNALPNERFAVSLNGAPLNQATIRKHRVRHCVANFSRNWLRGKALAGARFDINLFLEEPVPGFLRQARFNAFIPNPEWLRNYQRFFLPGIDLVLCKTRCAEQTFARLGATTKLLGFTSEDRFEPDTSRQREKRFLHIAGRSWQKGTRPLLDLWQTRPDWPMLTIVQNASTYSRVTVPLIAVPNIHHIRGYLDDTELKQLQNRCAFHLCPSEVEGFGHCIVEAMSCSAAVITTDAPPMNELVTPERGLLAGFNRQGKQRYGDTYFVDPASLEKAIDSLLSMDNEAREGLGQAARRWYLQNDLHFKQRLIELLT